MLHNDDMKLEYQNYSDLGENLFKLLNINVTILLYPDYEELIIAGERNSGSGLEQH